MKGGFFANLEIHGGKVVLDNVTTINQANLNDKSSDGKEIVGMGIVVYYEGPTSDTTITIKNNLTQKTVELLTEDKEDIEAWLTGKIESQIAYTKPPQD